MKIPDSLPVFIGDVEFTAYFDYQPPESATQTYPGCDESVTLCSVEKDGLDITALVSNEEAREIEEQLLTDLHEYMGDDGKGDYLYQLRKEERL